MAARKRTAEPASEPITLDEAKQHLRVDIDDDNDYITGLIVAARKYIEDTTRRSFFTQTWRLSLDAWPCSDEIELPRAAPLASVSSVIYTDSEGNSITVSTSVYDVDTDSEPGRVVLKYGQSWPSPTLRSMNPIQITYITGYSDVDDIPATFKHLIKLLVAHWYENREPVGGPDKEVPLAVDSLTYLNRVY